MIKDYIYFDHNATTDILPEVLESIHNFPTIPMNPSSPHGVGQYAKKILEESRSVVMEHLKADPSKYKMIFTASATEANNIAIKGLSHKYTPITSPIEHESVLKVIGEGIIPVDSNGIVDLQYLEKILSNSDKKYLVSIMMANSVTGVIEPIKEIIDLCHKYGAILHSDATQAIAKIPVSLEEMDVDILTMSSHKMGGPLGVGALIYKKDLDLYPIMIGGGQEYRLRSGTHNIRAIQGFAVAMRQINTLNKKWSEVAELRDYLEREILNVSPSSVIFSKDVARLPNTTYVSMPGMGSDSQLMYFDLHKVAISKGSACSSGKVSLPYVPMAMGFDQDISESAIRISLAPSNSKEEVDKFISLWKEI